VTAETRRHNPLLNLPAAQRVRALPPEAKTALRDLLLDLCADARARGDDNWRRNKAMIAAYWRCVSVYARHAARLCR
jgi:hypothetical protein